MNVEERVRHALQQDGERIEVPPPPSRAALERPRRRSPRRLVLAAGAAAAVLLLIALLVPRLIPSRMVEIAPVDDPPDLFHEPGVQWPDFFDPTGEHVFADGVFGDLRWVAAANEGHLRCVGVQIQGEQRAEAVSGCGPGSPSPVVATHTGVGEDGVMAVAGWVSDDVARLVWELPEADVELELTTHGDLPVRLFGGAGKPGDEVTILRAYDSTGRSLGGTGIRGASRGGDG
jgi:hypothetical protein